MFKNNNNCGWAIESDTNIVITYAYGTDTFVIPFIISVGYTVLLNNCDRIALGVG